MKVTFDPGFTPEPQPPARPATVNIEVSVELAAVLLTLVGGAVPTGEGHSKEISEELFGLFRALQGVEPVRIERFKLERRTWGNDQAQVIRIHRLAK